MNHSFDLEDYCSVADVADHLISSYLLTVLLDLMASQPRSFAIACLAELGIDGPRTLAGALMVSTYCCSERKRVSSQVICSSPTFLYIAATGPLRSRPRLVQRGASHQHAHVVGDLATRSQDSKA